MPTEDDPKEFPDVSQKLSAPKKLSAFEKERQAAEEKRRRAEAENAAALKDFENSFGGEEEDKYDGFPRFNAPPSGPRGGFGGPPNRYGAGLPKSGPGSLGPGLAPPSLKRKRALDEMREAQEARREQEGLIDDYPRSRSAHREDSYSSAHEDDREDIAPRPTVQLSCLPPSMNSEEVKLLLRDFLPVHSVRFQPPTGPDLGVKKSLTAIATLSTETSTSQIDAAVSALKDKYLGYGFSLSISRHLSSTSLLPSISAAPSALSTEPFGAQKINKEQPGRFSMRSAPPPSEFAPPDSYEASSRSYSSAANATIAVQPPLEIGTIRAIHTMVDRLLSEPDPDRALELEAMLMALPEVAQDERFSFLYDSRSTAGVYYRFLLWNDDESFESIQERKRLAKGPDRVLDDIVIDWVSPHEEVPFADLSKLGEVIDHMNYESSDEDSEDAEERRYNVNGREGEGPPTATDKKHLTPLQVAKFAWMLSRMPPVHSRLRKGDVAAITSFAINHAGAGADEIVDMLVLNVRKPFTSTQCARFDKEEFDQDEDDVYEPDEELPLIDDVPASDQPSGEMKEAEDPSAAKLVSLYLINDILHNSSTAGVRNAWKYRQLFENSFKRQRIFEHLGRLDKELSWGRMKMDKWRRQIGVLFDIWEHGSVFASDVFAALKKNFFEQPVEESNEADHVGEKNLDDKLLSRFKRIDGTSSPGNPASPAPGPVVLPPVITSESDANIDGTPIEDLDGMPMDDLDGTPMDDLDGAPMDGLDGVPMDDLDGLTGGDAAMTDAAMTDAAPATEESVNKSDITDDSKSGLSFKPPSQSKQTSQSGPGRRRKLAEDMFADSDEE